MDVVLWDCLKLHKSLAFFWILDQCVNLCSLRYRHFPTRGGIPSTGVGLGTTLVKMPKRNNWFQALKCEYLLIQFVWCYCKLNIFALWKQIEDIKIGSWTFNWLLLVTFYWHLIMIKMLITLFCLAQELQFSDSSFFMTILSSFFPLLWH